MKQLVWYRNDLRIHDHEPLLEALKRGPATALYCFDPRHFANTEFGFPKTGSLRAQFLIESVAQLRKSLGGNLIIRIGEPEVVIPKLAAEAGFEAIHYHKDDIHEEWMVEQNLGKVFPGEMNACYGHTLYHIDDLPFELEELPDIFTSFRKLVEKKSRVRAPLPATESIPEPLPDIDYGALPNVEQLGLPATKPDHRAVIPFRGGEEMALERLNHYYFETGKLARYKQTRNGLLGADYSSKFSPWLANGSLSARRIYQETERFEKEIKKNESTYWMKFELIWRDFFRFSAIRHGNAIFSKGGIRGTVPDMRQDPALFEKWKLGQTGVPFIDANMRELLYTGFMSNRGRQNVASFLSQDLQLDWRMGAAWFESMLIDYDVASNWGNWAYNSTVGHDPRNRKFFVTGQAQRYDPSGDYVRFWIPELATLPAELIHEPWKLTREQQAGFGVMIGSDYPAPAHL